MSYAHSTREIAGKTKTDFTYIADDDGRGDGTCKGMKSSDVTRTYGREHAGKSTY